MTWDATYKQERSALLNPLVWLGIPLLMWTQLSLNSSQLNKRTANIELA